MKETPILMNGPMVQATLEGRKTQTRRLIIPQPDPEWWPVHNYIAGSSDAVFLSEGRSSGARDKHRVKCPFGQVGDRLWVRETWCCKMNYNGEFIYGQNGTIECYYRATEHNAIVKLDENGGQEYRHDGTEASPWVPSIHMPRWASRITLEITEIRAERLNCITQADCLKEGATVETHQLTENCKGLYPEQCAFRVLWDSTKPKLQWKDNPYVWVLQFQRIKP